MLEQRFETAANAALQAYEAATGKESVAENKYDTFGLEASYLAHGQSQRVLDCENDLKRFSAMEFKSFQATDEIAIGALVGLIDDSGKSLICFLSPCAGGQTFKDDAISGMLITPSSPLGKSIMGSLLEDEIKVNIGNEVKFYEITYLE